ncbi:MAG TPA: tetratricopeptide repeat protein [Steroidobacteraceae bacterium]|nr:tetratricopeptide repeat protein [Steroidobacteraceae bacterium]
MLETATEQHRAGNLAAARRLYAEVLAADPAHALALFRSGLLELQSRHPHAALELITQAAAAAPEDARFQFGLAQALQALDRWPDAAEAYRRVLRSDPDSFDAHLALGVALQRAGQLAQAAAAYRSALALRPHDAAGTANLGAVLREMGDVDQAIELLRVAVNLEPLAASHAVNLGIALCQRRDFRAAELILRETLAREPHHAEAAFNLGNALRGLGRARAALEQYRHAAALRPDYADAFNNLGNVHKELGDFSAAMAAFESALLARPDYVLALNNLGCLLRTLGRSDEAEAMLRRGLAIDPHHAALHDNLGNVLKDAGALDEAIACFRKALELDPENAATHSNLAYALNFQSLEARPILDECLRWNARFGVPVRPLDSARRPDVSPRRLKIGYVSPDFRDHCQSLFTVPLFAHHDHGAFEVFCYSSVERPDEYTRRIEGFADVWRDVRAHDDAALAEVIRADDIDILVDLTMHMANGRPLAFARKPAPVQIAWLAYPGTTGIGAIDYRLSDPRLDPQDFDSHYSERTLRLADSFWCYDPLTDQPDVNPLPALERGYLTFGCLNNPCKLTQDTLQLWGGVMRAVPDAKLLLMAPPGRHRRRLLQRLAAQGIAEERIRFVEFRPRAEYLRSYHDIDLGLDTFPYNGHTTSLDSLWMGVPMITRVGRTCVGRGGLSQLFHLGLTGLAADSDAGFVSTAVAWGSDIPRLAALRQQLRARLERCPLMDAARFAQSIEDAYRRAWTGAIERSSGTQ